MGQDDQADYEGELCMVIGNDISSRKLQRDPKLAGNVPQWGFSKGFHTFAPPGPCLVRPDLVGDPKKLLLRTIVDSETRQEEFVNDSIFDCAYLVSYLSSGTTLQRGWVIITGTPGDKYPFNPTIFVILES